MSKVAKNPSDDLTESSWRALHLSSLLQAIDPSQVSKRHGAQEKHESFLRSGKGFIRIHQKTFSMAAHAYLVSRIFDPCAKFYHFMKYSRRWSDLAETNLIILAKSVRDFQLRGHISAEEAA